MPNPKPNETEKEFIPRCMETYSNEGKDLKNEKVRKQCLAICYSKFRNTNEGQNIINKIDMLIDSGIISGDVTGNGDTMMSTVKCNIKKKNKKKAKENNEI